MHLKGKSAGVLFAHNALFCQYNWLSSLAWKSCHINIYFIFGEIAGYKRCDSVRSQFFFGLQNPFSLHNFAMNSVNTSILTSCSNVVRRCLLRKTLQLSWIAMHKRRTEPLLASVAALMKTFHRPVSPAIFLRNCILQPPLPYKSMCEISPMVWFVWVKNYWPTAMIEWRCWSTKGGRPGTALNSIRSMEQIDTL